MLRWCVEEPPLVEKSVEERVDAAHPGDSVVLKRALQVRRGSRAGHQNVGSTHVEEAEKIDRESKNVIQRQGCQDCFQAGSNELSVHLKHLSSVSDKISVSEHRTLRDTCCSSGVLQGRD